MNNKTLIENYIKKSGLNYEITEETDETMTLKSTDIDLLQDVFFEMARDEKFNVGFEFVRDGDVINVFYDSTL